MKKQKVLRSMAVIIMVSFMAACSSVPKTTVEESVPFTDFLVKLDPKEKTNHLKKVVDESAAKKAYDDAYLEAGRLVYTGEDDVKLTLRWDKDRRLLTSYQGHITSTFGSESQIVLQLITEPDRPVPVVTMNRITGKPEFSVAIANVSTQATLPREFALRSMGILASASQGVIAAKIYANDDCGDNCGNITLYNEGAQSSAGADANANATGNANASSGGCPSGNCVAPPMD